MIFGREPALFFALFAAIFNLALVFGLTLTMLQIAGINTAMFALVGFMIRQNVTPVSP